MERGRHKMVENVDQDGKPLGTFYCATCRSRSFDHLSKQERAVVGDPEDYEWEKA